MILNRSYGFWSTLLSIVGTLLLMTVYAIADGPQGYMAIIIGTMFIISIVLLLGGLMASILAIKNKETGRKKYTGIFIPVVIILFIVLVPVLMAIGFIINDHS